MLIDLIAVWKNGPLLEIVEDSQEEKLPFVAQSSIHFDTPPQIVFVKDLHTRTEAYCYGDLPSLPLQPAEQKIYEDTIPQVAYNGRQMLLTGAIYDTTTNVLYLEAVRVRYAALAAFEKMKQIKAAGSVLSNQEFFKTGVLAAFISGDNKVTTIARNDKWKLRSVAAGFLECEKDSDLLINLVENTALKEADEEFGVDSHTGYKRFDYVGLPTIASVSFREAIGMSGIPTMEMIAPIRVKQDAKYVLNMMDNNTASHAHEHVSGTAMSIPLEYDERPAASSFINQGLPGSFLYGPVLHACAQKINSEMPTAGRMAGIPHSRFYPMGIFKPVPEKALIDHSTNQQQRSREKEERRLALK